MAVKKSQYFTLTYDAVDLGKIISMTLNIDGNEIPISSFDTSIFNEYLKGRNDVTMDVTCLYDQADTTGVGNMVDDLLANAADATISIGPKSGAAGDITYSGSGFPLNASFDFNDDDRPEVSGSFRINGTFTKSTAT